MDINSTISSYLPDFGSPTLQGVEFEPSSTPGVLRMTARKGRQFVRFYHKDFYNPSMAKIAKEQNDPSLAYERKLFVQIVTPGDKSEYNNKAYEYHKREYWPQYKAFREGKTTIEGSPVADCEWIYPAEVTDLHHMKIFTIEQLQDAPDSAMEQLHRGFELREHARNWCKINTKGALEESTKRMGAELNDARSVITKQQGELDDLRNELKATRDLIEEFTKPKKAKEK